jgi:N-acetylglucosaminyl-diphospho-decaprenol L-rhamnosyltransferase
MTDVGAADWTIVTVTYNSGSDLAEWWSSPDLNGARWIVVDNDSRDDSAERALTLGAEVIRLGENVGFSKANNIALSRASTRYIAFVNPDVRIDVDSLGKIAELMTERGAIVCPQLVNPDGTPQPNGRGIPFLADKLAHRGLRVPGSVLSEYLPDTSSGPTYVAWAMGAAVCAEVETLREAGGWDERYFLYYEDHAFGLHAWERGQEVIVLPSVRWVHAWKRETKRLRLQPWFREVASASRFYSQYPSLLMPPTSSRRSRWSGRLHKFGAPANVEGFE